MILQVMIVSKYFTTHFTIEFFRILADSSLGQISINVHTTRNMDLEELRAAIQTNKIPVEDSVIVQFFKLMDTDGSGGGEF